MLTTPPSADAADNTPEDLAAAAAQERYREFLRLDDQIGQEGYESSAPYDTVLVSPQRGIQEVGFRQAQQLPTHATSAGTPRAWSRWTSSCPDMRVIVRRELPHPSATLDAFDIRDGYRYQAFTTNTARGQLAFLEARHRAHARVEGRIRTGKDTGLGHLPSRHEKIDAVWVELALIVADLLALAWHSRCC